MTERGQLERAAIVVDDYGSDVSTYTRSDGIADLDPTFAIIDGPQVVGESIARLLMTRRGILASAPDRGLDLEELQSRRLSQAGLRELHAAIEREVRSDDRVLDAGVEVLQTGPGTLQIRVLAQTAAGPFELVRQASAAGDLTEILV